MSLFKSIVSWGEGGSAVYHSSSKSCSSMDRRREKKKKKKVSTTTAGSWEVLPPLLKDYSVLWEAKVHEGLWNCFDHGWGSAQVTQSPLRVHVSLQLLFCDSSTWGDTGEINQSTLQLLLHVALTLPVLHDRADKSTNADCWQNVTVI